MNLAHTFAGSEAMAGPIDIYYLVKLTEPPVGHPSHLLLKLTQAEFDNWNQSEEDAAGRDVIRRRDQLIANYLSQIASSDQSRLPTAEVVGEFQGLPTDDVFYEQADRSALDIWVAPTKFGQYWVVFGSAATEDEFWRTIEEDEDISCLEPIRAARQVTVHFLNRSERTS